LLKMKQEIATICKDSDWEAIAEEPCRVTKFTPLGGVVENGEVVAFDKTTPYASIAIECKKLPQKITGLITHKVDFAHLWAAFKERGIKESEDVVIFWSKNHYKAKMLKFLPSFWPKLRVIICPKGAFDSISEWDFELRNMDSYIWDDIKIAEWKHEIMN